MSHLTQYVCYVECQRWCWFSNSLLNFPKWGTWIVLGHSQEGKAPASGILKDPEGLQWRNLWTWISLRVPKCTWSWSSFFRGGGGCVCGGGSVSSTELGFKKLHLKNTDLESCYSQSWNLGLFQLFTCYFIIKAQTNNFLSIQSGVWPMIMAHWVAVVEALNFCHVPPVSRLRP